MINESLPDSSIPIFPDDCISDERSFWRKEDTSDASCDYSTCEDSDTDKYCSANSVLGTSSVCSSTRSRTDFCMSELSALKNSSSERGKFVSKTHVPPNEIEELSDERRSSSEVFSSTQLRDNNQISTEETDIPSTSSLNKSSLLLAGSPSLRALSKAGAVSKSTSNIDSWLKSSQFLDNNSDLCNDCEEKDDTVDFVSEGRDSASKLLSSHPGGTLFSNMSSCEENMRGSFSLNRISVARAFNISSMDAQLGDLEDEYDSSLQADRVSKHNVFPENSMDCEETRSELTGIESSHNQKTVHQLGSFVNARANQAEQFYVSAQQNLNPSGESRFSSQNSIFSGSAADPSDGNDFEVATEDDNLPHVPLHDTHEKCESHVFGGRQCVETVYQRAETGSMQKTICKNPKITVLSDGRRSYTGHSSTLIPQQGTCPTSFYLMGSNDNGKDQKMTKFVFDMANCLESDVVLDQKPAESDIPVNLFSDMMALSMSPRASAVSANEQTEYQKHQERGGLSEEVSLLDEVENLLPGEFDEEMMDDMESILLGPRDSCDREICHRNGGLHSLYSRPVRDGTSSASTSGADDLCMQHWCPSTIDWVEVIGARQRKGNLSLGERLVGVREYTVYVIRVWKDRDQWETERRYRDFIILYHQLRDFFTENGLKLPSSWSNVQCESLRIFPNASANLVSDRSSLIQHCLQSVLLLAPSLGIPSCVLWFLSCSTQHASSSRSCTFIPPFGWQTLENDHGDANKAMPTLGKTISLELETRPCKSFKQLLESQSDTCFGCHKRFESRKSLMKEFVQMLGWRGPRFCEYTGHLFCTDCHTNDKAILPAKVLHYWDFSLFPVCQMAKTYLESIYIQPVLCIGAVNPFLFSKVPALLQILNIRKKIGEMLSCISCPFRRSLQRGMGSRRYLLEANEFFALRDLVDISKGAFATLPLLMDNLSKKIFEHITQQCLVCCDVAVACAARHACEDPSSLIFPFQEDEVLRCTSCNSSFHSNCYERLICCPCGALVHMDDRAEAASEAVNRDNGEIGVLSMLGISVNETSKGGFSDMFSKVKLNRLWGAKNKGSSILMSSLPSTL